MRQTWVGVIIWPATPKTSTAPVRIRSPGASAATIGITMATWPWLSPVRIPMTKLVIVRITGTGKGMARNIAVIWSMIPDAVRISMK